MTIPAKEGGLSCPKSALELLEMYFLDIRCHLLEAAAGLDRLERAQGAKEAMSDARVQQMMEALEMMRRPGTDRAEQFLRIFSDPR